MKSSLKSKAHASRPIKSEIAAQFQPPAMFTMPALTNPLPHSLMNDLHLPIWIKTQHSSPYFNSAMAQFIGLEQKPVNDEQWLQYIHPEDLEHLIILWRTANLTSKSFHKDCRVKHAKLGYRMCSLQIKFPAAEQPLYQWLLSITDIHEEYEKQLLLSQQIFRQNKMLDASVDCIKILTPDGKVMHMNRSGCLALGISADEKNFGMPWLNLLPNDARTAGEKALHLAASGQNARFAAKSLTSGQEVQHWDNILTPIIDENGATHQILCVSRNISPQMMAEEKLQHVIEEDQLTGLLNRRAFNKLFKMTLQDAQNRQQQVGLLLIDLDYFKHVNDTLGHTAGDHLLVTLGQRFQNCFDEHITVARLGGDEFAILVPHLKSQEQLLSIAHQAWMQMELPISYTGQFINGGMSIGCSIYPGNAQNASNLLKCADIALNDLKSSGRGGIRMFTQSMFEALKVTTQQLTLARSILKSDSIEPYYQPKVLLQDGRVIGFEALLRWHNQEGQLQLPCNIFAAFHDYELASGISDTMHRKIFKDIRQWMADGMEVMPISINAAPVEFLRDDYAEKLLKRMHTYSIPHHLIEIEITEQSLSEHGADYVIRALNLLKAAGIQISLDDFGTGHSSLTRLKDYPIDCIKIDKNFVEHMTNDQSALAIVKTISQLGSSIALDILVEGIETTEQLEMLKACNCNKGQGFYFYTPMNSTDAEQLLSTR